MMNLDGITREKCAAACSEKGCVISGIGVCAHPLKGGLRQSQMQDPAALERLQKARRTLALPATPAGAA